MKLKNLLYERLFVAVMILPALIVCVSVNAYAQNCSLWKAVIQSEGTLKFENGIRIPSTIKVSNVFIGPPVYNTPGVAGYNYENHKKVGNYVSRVIGVPANLIEVATHNTRQDAERWVERRFTEWGSIFNGSVHVPDNCSGEVPITRSEPVPYVFGNLDTPVQPKPPRRTGSSSKRPAKKRRGRVVARPAL